MRTFGLALIIFSLGPVAPGQESLEADWTKLVQLEKRSEEKPPISENAVEFYRTSAVECLVGGVREWVIHSHG